MATFIERYIEAAVTITTGEAANREAELLTRAINQHLKNQANPFDLMPLETRRNELKERARLALLRLSELEREQANAAEIKVISWNDSGAQIVIRYSRDDGKKVSFTRHIHYDGKAYTGFSTLTTQKVSYRLPDAAIAEAA